MKRKIDVTKLCKLAFDPSNIIATPHLREWDWAAQPWFLDRLRQNSRQTFVSTDRETSQDPWYELWAAMATI